MTEAATPPRKRSIERIVSRQINFGDAAAKSAFVRQVQALDGIFDVSITKRKRKRSNPQNSYYWAAIIPSVAAGLREAWGESLSADEVHILLKDMFLARSIVNRETGEEIGRVHPSSAVLSVEEFSEYIEKIMKFAASSLGTVIPSASEHF